MIPLGKSSPSSRATQVTVAHFIVNGEELEAREVEQQWLLDAWTNHDNVLLKDGNPYRIVDVKLGDATARVELEAPRVAPGG